MSHRWVQSVVAVALSVICSRCIVASELDNLVKDYNAQKPKMRAGDLGQRLEKAKNELRPRLLRIAKLNTPEAIAFLRNELEKETPEVAAQSVEPLLAALGDKAMDPLVGEFPKRSRPVRSEIARQLTKRAKLPEPVVERLPSLFLGEKEAEPRLELATLLGKLDTIAAAKALIQSAGNGGSGKGKAAQEGAALDARIVAALRESKSGEVKEFLGGAAWQGASGSRVEVLTELAGALKLEAARGELEKAIDSSDDGLAVRALEALLKIGPGASASKMSEALGRAKRSLAFKIQALDAMAEVGSDECVASILDAAKSADAETRAIAMGSLGKIKKANEKAYEGIVAGLKDSESNVRHAAVRALRLVRHKKMVPALIEFLGQEKDDKLRIDALQFLIALTGKNMGLVTEDWQKWWEIAEATFEFPKEGAVVATSTKAHDLKYFGIEVASKRFALLVDASGSMTGQMDVYAEERGSADKPKTEGQTTAQPAQDENAGKDGKADKDTKDAKPADKRRGAKSRARRIDVLKKELARFVQSLPKDAMVNIVPFSATFKPWQDQLQPMGGGGREKAVQFVKDLNTSSGTNVFDTLEFALKDKRVDTIFLLTDGEPSRGRFTAGEAIIREITALNRVRGVTIHCIAFGEKSDFLKKLAESNGGTYRYVDSF